MPALLREVGPHQNGKVTDAAPICTPWMEIGAQTCLLVALPAIWVRYRLRGYNPTREAGMAQRRLSEDERAALAARCEQLQLELRLLTAELRTDEALRRRALAARLD